MLKSKGIIWPVYTAVSKRLLSNEIKEVFDTRLAAPNSTNGNHLQLAVVSKNLNAVNLDLFVNNLSSHDDRSSAVLDLIAKLRATKSANSCLESTHFAVVRHLLENCTIQDVIPVLLDRPKYGIFLNNFTAFAVTQMLHEEKEYNLGLPLALKLVLSNEVDSLFVQGFCLKASLETLKSELFANKPVDDKASGSPKGKVQEKKIRVKFLRNALEYDIEKEIGKAILKIESRILEGNIKEVAKILGFVLTKNYTALDKALGGYLNEINEDIADICKKTLSRENQDGFVEQINKLQSNTLFGNFIDKFLAETSAKEAVSLAEKQKQLFSTWQQLRDQKHLETEKEIAKQERIENIEVTENEITKKKDLLWFFENEDKLDLEIYNKQVFYPKKWFGKKKKPRVVDEHYVPPHIRKII